MASPLKFEDIESKFGENKYLADEALVTAIYLAMELGKPLLLEGVPGVGKTQVARVLSTILERECVRLQCYEGIDANQALYEWDYPKQLLSIRQHESSSGKAITGDVDIYDPSFLIERPLLKAIRSQKGVVLLIDEIDRSDDAFEAFLLEFLSDYQISIPELGTISAQEPVLVILTSNRTRELHDALRRRCLYHWIDYPSAEREQEIVRLYEPDISTEAAQSLIEAVTNIRALPVNKKPGIAETIDWAKAATILERRGIAWPDALRRTLGLIVKDQEDMDLVVSGKVV